MTLKFLGLGAIIAGVYLLWKQGDIPFLPPPNGNGNGGGNGDGNGNGDILPDLDFKIDGSGTFVILDGSIGDGLPTQFRPFPAHELSNWVAEWGIEHIGPAGWFQGIWVTGAGGGTFGDGDVENFNHMAEQTYWHWHYVLFEVQDDFVWTKYTVKKPNVDLPDTHFQLTPGDFFKRDDSGGEFPMSLGMDMDVSFFVAPTDRFMVDAINYALTDMNRDDDVFEFVTAPLQLMPVPGAEDLVKL